MSVFTVVVLVTAVVSTVAGFGAGWWLARREHRAHITSLRTELQATYARAQRERISLREQYEHQIGELARAAFTATREVPHG